MLFVNSWLISRIVIYVIGILCNFFNVCMINDKCELERMLEKMIDIKYIFLFEF